MQRTRIQDMVIGLVVIAIGLYGASQAMKMPEGTKPYTLVVTLVFALLGALLVGQSLLKRNIPSNDSSAVTLKEVINPLIAFIMIVAYTSLLNVVGFFTCSAVFMLVMMVWMGYRKPIPMVLTTAVMLGFIYALFVIQLKVALPRGILM